MVAASPVPFRHAFCKVDPTCTHLAHTRNRTMRRQDTKHKQDHTGWRSCPHRRGLPRWIPRAAAAVPLGSPAAPWLGMAHSGG